jgi:hypothetical protein
MALVSSNYMSDIPWSFHGSAIPVNDPSTSIFLDYIVERSWDDTVDIIKLTTTTVSTTTTGANGILVSGNLGGTVSISNGANTVTAYSGATNFLNDFQIGDTIVVNNVKKTVVSISSTSITVDSNYSTNLVGTTYQRGGASDTWYYLYAISYSNGSNVALALSTRSVASGDTLVDLPTSYTKYRQLPCVWKYNTGLSSFQRMIIENWPYQPVQKIIWDFATTTATQQIFRGIPPTTWTTVSVSSLVPKISTIALINCYSDQQADNAYYIADENTVQTQITNQGRSATCHNNKLFLSLTYRSFQHKAAATANAQTISYITGFIITEAT